MGRNKKNNIKRLKMVIFKWLFLSYMPTILYFSFYYANSIAMLYLVHKYKKTLESTNMGLAHSYILIFASFSSYGGMVVQLLINLGNPL